MDTEARFRALFADSYSALRRYAHHRGLSPADSEDLVAEVFTIAWRRIDDVPTDAVPWLFAVARNVLRNTRRAELVAWDGLTPQQAATALGWTPGATRVRLHRARHRLAAKLDAAETPSTLRTGTHRERAARPEVPDAHT